MRMEELLIGATLLLGIGMLSSCNIRAEDLGLPVLYTSEEAITKTQECEGEECSPSPEFVEDEVSGRAPSCNKTDKAEPQKVSGLICN